MKRIFVLDALELHLLLKGKVLDLGQEHSVALSPEALERTRGGKEEGEKKPKLKGGLTRDQKYKMGKYIKKKGDLWVCHLCSDKEGWKQKSGATMHYMRTHIRGWKGGGK